MKLVELTDEADSKIWVNLANVVAIGEFGDMTLLRVAGGDNIIVKQTPEQIIARAQRSDLRIDD